MPLASPVPIYLGCAGLIIGGLGLGAQHMLRGNAAPATAQEQPLFAQSVEGASLPATAWPSQSVGVAYYEPMRELLSTPTRSTQPSQEGQPSQAAQPPQQEQREVVRDLSQPQTKPPSRRARNQPNRDDARAHEDSETADTRMRPDRRRVEIEDDRPRAGERRTVIREEPEPRIVRGTEQRDGGFTPFRLFGIFER